MLSIYSFGVVVGIFQLRKGREWCLLKSRSATHQFSTRIPAMASYNAVSTSQSVDHFRYPPHQGHDSRIDKCVFPGPPSPKDRESGILLAAVLVLGGFAQLWGWSPAFFNPHIIISSL